MLFPDSHSYIELGLQALKLGKKREGKSLVKKAAEMNPSFSALKYLLNG